jgi:hypothetical protein
MLFEYIISLPKKWRKTMIPMILPTTEFTLPIVSGDNTKHIDAPDLFSVNAALSQLIHIIKLNTYIMY